ncbi:hypothetical protein [Sphingobacterium sp. WOUb80]|uniref:hypothetical protein n=1 Tax=Sphingobacterium sp. WOUb80 TaxID=3234028 RepID=UPI003CF47208
MGLNLDGSSNLGVRAIPDFPIEAKNSEERLEKLLVFFTVKPFLRLSIFDIVLDLTYNRMKRFMLHANFYLYLSGGYFV